MREFSKRTGRRIRWEACGSSAWHSSAVPSGKRGRRSAVLIKGPKLK